MTKEQRHMMNVAALGCIVCKWMGFGFSPAEPHHLLKGGRRIDDFHTIPLCHLHRRAGVKDDAYVSRHPWKREFERSLRKRESIACDDPTGPEMNPIIVAKLISMKPSWITKPPKGKHYATLMDDCLYGPFDSLAEAEEWAKAPWVSVDSPH